MALSVVTLRLPTSTYTLNLSDLEVAQKGPPAGTNLRNHDKVGQNANPETR